MTNVQRQAFNQKRLVRAVKLLGHESIDPKSLGINTGPLDTADFGVPGVNTPFGHIGGVAGYPITTAPTTTTQIGS